MWVICYKSAKARCENPKHPAYKNYGGKGVRMLLTVGDVEMLYRRDNAKSMKRASIDRVDNDGDYTIDNCRFIELAKNVGRRFK